MTTDLFEYFKLAVAVAIPIAVAWMSLNTRLTKIEMTLGYLVTGKLKISEPKEEDAE